MNTLGGNHELANSSEHEVAQLEGRLQQLADYFVQQSRLAGPDAIELLQQGSALQRAAFVLRTARSSEIDLRGDV